MQANRYSYVDHYDLPALQRMLQHAYDRSIRAETMSDALSDQYVIQELEAAIAMKREK